MKQYDEGEIVNKIKSISDKWYCHYYTEEKAVNTNCDVINKKFSDECLPTFVVAIKGDYDFYVSFDEKLRYIKRSEKWSGMRRCDLKKFLKKLSKYFPMHPDIKDFLGLPVSKQEIYL